MSPSRLPALAAFLAFVPFSGIRADIAPASLFQSGAVLQRDTDVPVWGTSTRDGEKVTVTLDGGTPVETVAKNGAWSVKLPPHKAGGPHRLTIAGDNRIELNDILFGEVWICSGQSNMEMNITARRHALKPADAAAVLKIADVPGVRLFDVRNALSPVPLKTVSGKWRPCGAESVKAFSLVGFHFARHLKRALGDVPVGLIESDWGGTPAQGWTSREGLEKLPAWKPRVEKFAADVVKNPKILNQNQPTALYNAMIAPLAPYAMRGVIWYQGESNGSTAAAAKDYRTLFPGMIADWRAQWGRGDFPFLFVQIAPFYSMIPEIREAQFLTLEKSPHTAMVQTIDVGDPRDIHPVNKEPVGARLALAARALAYGEKVEWSGPLFAGATFENGRAIVSFTHAEGGLELKTAPAGTFKIAGADKKFVAATAVVENGKLVVSAPGVHAPVAVRYGWSNTPVAVLFNKGGLPASPFRSDVE